QVYGLLALLLAGAWVTLRAGRPAVAGVLLGAAGALKPPFLVWPALLWLAGERKPLWWAAASGLALTLAPMALLGPQILPGWVEAVRVQTPRTALYPGMISLWAVAAQLGLPLAGALASTVLTA